MPASIFDLFFGVFSMFLSFIMSFEPVENLSGKLNRWCGKVNGEWDVQYLFFQKGARSRGLLLVAVGHQIRDF